ncbi:MAG TPA: SDR family oxidoreductase [Solirubrobacteraceae bacterium]|nr:SDR family oxidoreductase [Solirubrobacteraceae bacterium]
MLVTGASGVVGDAVVESLDGYRIIALGHQSESAFDVENLKGNVAEEQLGLSAETYAQLQQRVDAVVHCAAMSTYATSEAEMRNVNVGGTERMLDFCAGAQAPLYHMSTALDAEVKDDQQSRSQRQAAAGGSPFSREPYLQSKRDAEVIVRASGLPFSILRPSLVIGNSKSGSTPRFQGVHTATRILLDEEYGVLPARPTDHADYIPRDVIGDAVAVLIDQQRTPELVWLTVGERAPTVKQAIDVILEFGRGVGVHVEEPKYMDPETVDRLIRPALLPELPRRTRQRFEFVIEFSYALGSERFFPSSLDDFEGLMAVPSTADLIEALWSSLRFWHATKNGSQNGGM